MAKIRCPRFFCNSRDIQLIYKKKEKFSVSNAVLGALVLGSSLGVLLGVEPAISTYKCMKCGKTWKV